MTRPHVRSLLKHSIYILHGTLCCISLVVDRNKQNINAPLNSACTSTATDFRVSSISFLSAHILRQTVMSEHCCNSNFLYSLQPKTSSPITQGNVSSKRSTESISRDASSTWNLGISKAVVKSALCGKQQFSDDRALATHIGARSPLESDSVRRWLM